MTFTNASESLTENDTDETFTHDEHVDFNGTDSIITSIHWVPANAAICK